MAKVLVLFLLSRSASPDVHPADYIIFVVNPSVITNLIPPPITLLRYTPESSTFNHQNASFLTLQDSPKPPRIMYGGLWIDSHHSHAGTHLVPNHHVFRVAPYCN